MRNSYLILDEYVSAYMYKSDIALYCFYYYLFFIEVCVQSDVGFHCWNTVENTILN